MREMEDMKRFIWNFQDEKMQHFEGSCQGGQIVLLHLYNIGAKNSDIDKTVKLTQIGV